jgi:hypothetical protein
MVITSEEANEPPEQPSCHWSIRGDPSSPSQQRQQAGSINPPTIPPPVAGSSQRYVGRSDQLSADSAIANEKQIPTSNVEQDTVSINSSSNSSTCKQGSSQTSTICDFAPNSTNSYACQPSTVADYLGSDLKNGLCSQDAEDRLVSNGPNRLETQGGVSVVEVLLRQVSNSLTLVSDEWRILMRWFTFMFAPPRYHTVYFRPPQKLLSYGLPDAIKALVCGIEIIPCEIGSMFSFVCVFASCFLHKLQQQLQITPDACNHRERKPKESKLMKVLICAWSQTGTREMSLDCDNYLFSIASSWRFYSPKLTSLLPGPSHCHGFVLWYT